MVVDRSRSLFFIYPPSLKTPNYIENNHIFIKLLHMDASVLADQQGFTIINSVRTLDSVYRNCQ